MSCMARVCLVRCAHLERVSDFAMHYEIGNEAAVCSSTWTVRPADNACCWPFLDTSLLTSRHIELAPVPRTLKCTHTADLTSCCAFCSYR